ncbi:glycoside hydrolase superfamily [Mycena vitilis]|nr:glycoside hydrolase superfamily [Mycena vitilis]
MEDIADIAVRDPRRATQKWRDPRSLLRVQREQGPMDRQCRMVVQVRLRLCRGWQGNQRFPVTPGTRHHLRRLSDNMFQTHIVSLEPSSLKPQNTLLLLFKSALHHAKALEAKMGAFRAGSTNLGDPSRLYVRKAQYDWRKTQGLELTTCGSHRPIVFKTYTEDAPSTTGALSWALAGLVEPWWPVGYGAQHLYTVSVSLIGTTSQTPLDESTPRVGFRRVALVQDPLEELYWRRCSNWVRADNFLTAIAPERYRAWLTLLRDGNQNMVRLWGTACTDVFYDPRDELGILVWQNFQFACGVYPAHGSFVASVRKEAEDNVRRLRHHPALALFCGNNEDYQMVMQWGGVKSLPAIKIYEEVLPEVLEALTGPQPIPYHRGSPYGGKGWDTADPTIGDVHQWNMGRQGVPLARLRQARRALRLPPTHVLFALNSEFGIPSHPEMKTIQYWLDGAGEEARHAQSADGAALPGGQRRVPVCDLGVQGDGRPRDVCVQHATHAIRSGGLRQKWGGRGKEYLRPKSVYFTIAKLPATYSVGVLRTGCSAILVIKNRANDRPPQYYEFGDFQSYGATLEIWGTNASLSPRAPTLEIYFVDLKFAWTHTVTLLPKGAGGCRRSFEEGEGAYIVRNTSSSSAGVLNKIKRYIKYKKWH